MTSFHTKNTHTSVLFVLEGWNLNGNAQVFSKTEEENKQTTTHTDRHKHAHGSERKKDGDQSDQSSSSPNSEESSSLSLHSTAIRRDRMAATSLPK